MFKFLLETAACNTYICIQQSNNVQKYPRYLPKNNGRTTCQVCTLSDHQMEKAFLPPVTSIGVYARTALFSGDLNVWLLQ